MAGLTKLTRVASQLVKMRTPTDSTLDANISFVTVQQYGGKADFDPTTQNTTTATNLFPFLKEAVANGLLTGRKDVRIPAGHYYVKLTGAANDCNLGGTGYYGTDGVTITGAGKQQTVLWVDAENEEDVLFSIRGGSGSVSSKAIKGLTIRCINSNRAKGNFIVVENACFSTISNFDFISGYTQLKFLNGVSAGGFTEFNTVTDGRFNAGKRDVVFEVNGGDNSFHGIKFYCVQFQVQTAGGIGIKVNGITAPAYLYNMEIYGSFFGGSNCYAFSLKNCNTDNVSGNLTHEGALICRTEDAQSVFEFKGNFAGIGSVTYDVFQEPTARLSAFVFNNTMSNTANFSNASLNTLSPRPYNPQMADATDNGITTMMYVHQTASGQRGLGLNCSSDSFGFLFTTTLGGNLQTAVPKYRLSPDGNAMVAYSGTFYLNPNNSTYGVQLSADTGVFAPRTTNLLKLGTGSFRWSELHTQQIDVVSAGIVPVSNNSISLGATGQVFKDAFLQNAPTVVSDADSKSFIQSVPTDVIEAIKLIEFKMWKLKDSVSTKGEEARWHFGIIAQDVVAAFSSKGLDAYDYGLVCKDEVTGKLMVRMEEILSLKQAASLS